MKPYRAEIPNIDLQIAVDIIGLFTGYPITEENGQPFFDFLQQEPPKGQTALEYSSVVPSQEKLLPFHSVIESRITFPVQVWPVKIYGVKIEPSKGVARTAEIEMTRRVPDGSGIRLSITVNSSEHYDVQIGRLKNACGIKSWGEPRVGGRLTDIQSDKLGERWLTVKFRNE